MKRILGLVLCSLVLAGCGPAQHSVSHPTMPSSEGTGPTAPATTRPHPPPTLAEIVHDRRARLLALRVGRTDNGVRVQAAWGYCRRTCRQAITASSDGFATATYRRSTKARFQSLVRASAGLPTASMRQAAAPLSPHPVPSFTEEQAMYAGGEGLVPPFTELGRSTDGGHTWQMVKVPTIQGRTAYSPGGVLLPDGRLLMLLDAWDADPGDMPRGLWRSDDTSWLSYRPLDPSFRPKLDPAPQGEPDLVGISANPAGGLITVTTWDDRVYVSTDAARTFREVQAR